MATLFRVSHPDTWGENPDERSFFCISSGFLGRFPGRVSLLHTPWKDYGQKVTEVYRKTSSKHRFWIPLGNKTGKKWSRCFRTGTNQRVLRRAIPAGGSQNVLRYAIPISTSQGRRAFISLAGLGLNRWRSFLPSMVLATQIASGGRICQRRRSLEFETHIFTLDPFLLRLYLKRRQRNVSLELPSLCNLCQHETLPSPE